jgi:hypothetical protein
MAQASDRLAAYRILVTRILLTETWFLARSANAVSV